MTGVFDMLKNHRNRAYVRRFESKFIYLFYKKITIFLDFRHAMSLRILSTFDSRAFQGVLDGYKNGTKFHRLERNSTVQYTGRGEKFSPTFFFCPER